MYISPAAHANSKTPSEYKNRARDEITRKLFPTTNLKYGSSSLKIVTNASDTSLNKTRSNDSLDSQPESAPQKESNTNTPMTKKLFGRLRSIGSSQSSLKGQSSNLSRTTSNSSSSEPQDVEMSDDSSIISDPLAINNLQPLQPVPSIASSNSQFSNLSYQSQQSSKPSVRSKYSMADSLFSNQQSLATQLTNVSDYSTYSFQTEQPQPAQPEKLVLTLQEALPSSFEDMYSPELLADPNLLIDGRPMFTNRALLDWNLNDIRSLLIVERLRPEWNNQLPLIYPSSNHDFKFEYLPLDADDSTIVQTLVESDIYKEAHFDESFRIQTAKYTLATARRRHQQILKASGMPYYHNNRLSKPEWRNVIENFLLNLAVEAQCRYDYKKAIHDLKKQRRGGLNVTPKFGGEKSLLRKAIMNDVSQSVGSKSQAPSLTKDEKAEVWTNVQSNVYKRLGLDWMPDQISS